MWKLGGITLAAVVVVLGMLELSTVAAERARPPVFPEDGTTASIQRELPTGADTDTDAPGGPVFTR